MAAKMETITIRVDAADVLGWFKRQGPAIRRE
jgi:uncharacterized protein (DUF4415 family)